MNCDMKNTTGKENPVQINSSVQDSSKQDISGRLSPTHLSYWQGRVFQPTYKRDGVTRKTAHFSCKIQFAGHRESFPLHTANRDDAAQKARDIYVDIVRNGWDAALKTHKPKPIVALPVLTVGEFFRVVALTGVITHLALITYKTKLRSLIAFICKLGSGRAKGVRHREWRKKVDEQPLSVITLEALKAFQQHILSNGAEDLRKLTQASITYDGYVRNLRALFREKVRAELAHLGVILPPSLFDQLPFLVKGRSAFAYVSTIRAKSLMKAAVAELLPNDPDAFMVFALALLLGFRRNEIDGLRWDMVNWERKHIALVPHEFLHLKTPGSSAEIRLEREMLSLLRQYRKMARGDYVVFSENAPRKAKFYRHYRCERHFDRVNQWLKKHGVTNLKPLHTLRKECGSLINEKHGLVAASKALRHASIDITVTYYLSDKSKGNTGLDHLLPSSKN
jgi:integrase